MSASKSVAFLAALGAIYAAPAMASTNLVSNGDFSQTTLTSSSQFTTEVTGWSNAATNGWTGYGYNFLIMPGTEDSTGFTSLWGNLDYLYGPNGTTRPGYPDGSNYASNGLTASSPSGGNYLLMDGDSNFHGAVSQTINGLTAGNQYQLTFEWAGASWFTTPGATTHEFDVTFGNATQKTVNLPDDPKGFSGWQTASMNFTATSSSQLLSFLAVGTPNGLPPTLLLDNVQLSAVPEPTSWAMMIIGFGAAGGALRRRRVVANAATA